MKIYILTKNHDIHEMFISVVKNFRIFWTVTVDVQPNLSICDILETMRGNFHLVSGIEIVDSISDYEEAGKHASQIV